MDQKTPLFAWHESHGGRMVSFAGYALPVQYETGVIAEHTAVRERAGLFDVSHMGEFVLSGPGALDSLQRLLTNDFTTMPQGRARYTLMCNPAGGVVDDLVVCRLGEPGEERWLLVVNAANRGKDAAWIRARLGELPSGETTVFEDRSGDYAQIALQGPAAEGILRQVSDTIPPRYYTLVEKGRAAGIDAVVSRTGYTGEAGFELYCAPADAPELWTRLLEAGRGAGLLPCGLGCRDTLRLEAAMPLYGHEMDETVTPFEAGLGFAVRMDKGDFIGREALASREPGRLRVGLRVTGKGIVRERETVFAPALRDAPVGVTTSGTYCPTLRGAFALALLDRNAARPGTALEVDVRGRPVAVELCPLPFYVSSSPRPSSRGPHTQKQEKQA